MSAIVVKLEEPLPKPTPTFSLPFSRDLQPEWLEYRRGAEL